ncbi:MAG TPA: ribulose-phosphate 3-epimerase [Thermodesulfobacteriota bacterium]|nr:ribulose-phosphate 3-epimerase [Thermodesulfobacteriota bacterium]
MKRIAPSILSADFSKLGEEVREVEACGADLIHCDVMDGHFVPNITIGPMVIKALSKVTKLPLDVHLMIEKPERYIKEFIEAGSKMLTIHVEATTHLQRHIQHIKEQGVKAGVSLNPSTPLEALDYILSEADFVLIMTVNPGFGGQKFLRSMLPKIKQLRKMINEKGLSAEIEVDGGIGVENIKDASQAGADIFVAGNAIFGSGDYRKTIQAMRKKIEDS